MTSISLCLPPSSVLQAAETFQRTIDGGATLLRAHTVDRRRVVYGSFVKWA
jgi:hypothetical protein